MNPVELFLFLESHNFVCVFGHLPLFVYELCQPCRCFQEASRWDLALLTADLTAAIYAAYLQEQGLSAVLPKAWHFVQFGQLFLVVFVVLFFSCFRFFPFHNLQKQKIKREHKGTPVESRRLEVAE